MTSTWTFDIWDRWNTKSIIRQNSKSTDLNFFMYNPDIKHDNIILFRDVEHIQSITFYRFFDEDFSGEKSQMLTIKYGDKGNHEYIRITQSEYVEDGYKTKIERESRNDRRLIDRDFYDCMVDFNSFFNFFDCKSLFQDAYENQKPTLICFENQKDKITGENLKPGDICYTINDKFYYKESSILSLKNWEYIVEGPFLRKPFHAECSMNTSWDFDKDEEEKSLVYNFTKCVIGEKPNLQWKLDENSKFIQDRGTTRAALFFKITNVDQQSTYLYAIFPKIADLKIKSNFHKPFYRKCFELVITLRNGDYWFLQVIRQENGTSTIVITNVSEENGEQVTEYNDSILSVSEIYNLFDCMRLFVDCKNNQIPIQVRYSRQRDSETDKRLKPGDIYYTINNTGIFLEKTVFELLDTDTFVSNRFEPETLLGLKMCIGPDDKRIINFQKFQVV